MTPRRRATAAARHGARRPILDLPAALPQTITQAVADALARMLVTQVLSDGGAWLDPNPNTVNDADFTTFRNKKGR